MTDCMVRARRDLVHARRIGADDDGDGVDRLEPVVAARDDELAGRGSRGDT